MAEADHPGRLAVPALGALRPYEPGKPITELERELGLREIVKLASNENPWGASPLALEAMRQALAQAWLYPDGAGYELKRALARHLGVDAGRLTLGNGSSELLMLLAESFLGPGRSAVYSQYGFAIYPIVIRATGACAIEAPALDVHDPMPLGHDLDAIAAAIRPDTRLVFIANPNNPTGTWADPQPLRRFIERVPLSTLVVLDEAYLEYGREQGAQDALPWLAARPNLVLLRTFSKAYGLAGVRVGYAVSHPEVAELLNRVRPTFNINSLAQAGAVAALGDQAHLRRVVTATCAGLARLQAGVRELGLWSAPSAANFLLVRVGDARAVFERLLRRGLITRPLGPYGLPGHLRISVGRPDELERLLVALAEVRGEVGAPT